MESDSTFTEFLDTNVKFHFYRARPETEEYVRRRCASRKSARRGEREVEEEKEAEDRYAARSTSKGS